MPDSTEAQTLKSPTAPSQRPEVCGPHAPERPYPIYLRGNVEKGFGRGSKDLGCPTANLPSKVVEPGSSLSRNGVYFGYARVLPQDEDDPSLTDSDDVDPTSAGIDDEDNEVVLGASPIGDEGFLNSSSLPRSRHNSRGQPSPAAVLEAGRRDKEDEVSRAEASHAQSGSSSSTSSRLTAGRRKKTKRIPLRAEDSKVFPMVMSVGWNPFYKNTRKTAEVHILHDFAADFYGLEIRVVVLGYVRPEYNYDTMEALIEDIEMDKKVTVNSLARPLYQDYAQDPFLGR
ncbi:Riboflavin kinase domain, bacterial/eukaryotic [Kalmanozyma brasiliensis GHG001]|uniref:Riboflavin kinase n=1 Tax=Kalmanozyma brasiliensis (strain GHG001) TaxID=1365824 RepID=V5EV30_KALBG|nr:Riboflavin kinase domain, bacterial/eukaryotic [Kalmanozyma brasiliensis GHG001]EST09300.1 Riboflavin kinase domain, bacterial/eukaryotic [Kalmanozyma brasiliensis GHG001]